MTERPHPDTPITRRALELRLSVQDPAIPEHHVSVGRIYAHKLEGAATPDPVEVEQAIRRAVEEATRSILDVVFDHLALEEADRDK